MKILLSIVGLIVSTKISTGLCKTLKSECPTEKNVLEQPKDKCFGDLTCEYGEECCCGECYPSLVSKCINGRWLSYFTDACYGASYEGCGGTYEFVESGTCESNGFRSIKTETECSEAATHFAKSSVDVIYREGNWRDRRPTGCSWHNFGNLELWSVSSGDCDVHGYAGCFCLNP